MVVAVFSLVFSIVGLAVRKLYNVFECTWEAPDCIHKTELTQLKGRLDRGHFSLAADYGLHVEDCNNLSLVIPTLRDKLSGFDEVCWRALSAEATTKKAHLDLLEG